MAYEFYFAFRKCLGSSPNIVNFFILCNVYILSLSIFYSVEHFIISMLTIGLYRENAIAVRVIDRSAYDVTRIVSEKTCRIYATAVAFTTCVPPVLRTYKLKVEQTVFRHE